MNHALSIPAVIPEKVFWTSKIGQFAVTFFFMVSGYFLIHSYGKQECREIPAEQKAENALMFGVNKLKRMYPEIFISTVIALCGYYILKFYIRSDTTNPYYLFYRLLPDFLGIRAVFMNREMIGGINTQMWYISAMVIVSPVLYYLLSLNKNRYVYILCPTLYIFLLNVSYLEYGKTEDSPRSLFLGILSMTLMKAFRDMSAGGVIYILSEKMKKTVFTKLGTIVVTVCELFLFTLMMCSEFVFEKKQISSVNYYISAVLLILFLSIVFSGKSMVSRIFQHKVFSWGEKWSFSVYLNHWVVVLLLAHYRRTASFKGSFCLLVVYSLILAAVERTILYFWKKRKRRIWLIEKQS